MGCYNRNGVYYITSKPRDKDWPQLNLPTTETDVLRVRVLESLVNDELRGGGRKDLAWALKWKHLTLDQLAALVGPNIKDVHNLSARALGLPVAQLPQPGGGAVLTFGEIEEAFLRDPRQVKSNRPLSKETLDRYRQSFVCLARYLGNGDADAGRLTPAARVWDVAVLNAYSVARKDPAQAKLIGHATRESATVTGSTINRDQRAFGALRAAALRTFTKELVGLVEPTPTLQAEDDVDEHLLEDGEFDAVLAYCDEQAVKPAPKSRALKQRDWHMFKFMLMVLYWTGARLSEMLRMKWGQWHLDEVEPYVLLEGHAELGEKHFRRLSVPPPLAEAMRTFRSIAQERGWRTDRSARVWQGPLRNRKTFQKGWNRTRKQLTAYPNVVQHRVHDFRHDAAVGWVRAGASIEEVRQALGHKNRDVTYRYTKYSAGTMQQAGLRRAAMYSTNCVDPLLAALLCDPVRAEEIAKQLLAAHPTLSSVVAQQQP